MIGFAVVAGMALAVLATVVLSPAVSRLLAARADRDALGQRVETYDELIDYKQRLAESIRTDPMQTRRLLMQQQNCRRLGEAGFLITDAPADIPLAEMIAGQTAEPRRESTIDRISRRVQQPRTRRGLLLVSGIMMVCAMVMFLPPGAGKK